MAALIAWMLIVRVDDLVKDGAISAVTRVFDALWRRRLRRSTILDKIINANRVPSKRSRPLSGPSGGYQIEVRRAGFSFCRARRPSDIDGGACPCGGTGRRARLKIVFRKEWGFDSLHGHQPSLAKREKAARRSFSEGGRSSCRELRLAGQLHETSTKQQSVLQSLPRGVGIFGFTLRRTKATA